MTQDGAEHHVLTRKIGGEMGLAMQFRQARRLEVRVFSCLSRLNWVGKPRRRGTAISRIEHELTMNLQADGRPRKTLLSESPHGDS
jgi:hypothetical protein